MSKFVFVVIRTYEGEIQSVSIYKTLKRAMVMLTPPLGSKIWTYYIFRGEIYG